jgi:hypothetical protein
VNVAATIQAGFIGVRLSIAPIVLVYRSIQTHSSLEVYMEIGIVVIIAIIVVVGLVFTGGARVGNAGNPPTIVRSSGVIAHQSSVLHARVQHTELSGIRWGKMLELKFDVDLLNWARSPCLST